MSFTVSLIEKTDVNTRVLFGNYTFAHNIQRVFSDKVTVLTYYECRITKLRLNATEKLQVETEADVVSDDIMISLIEHLSSTRDFDLPVT